MKRRKLGALPLISAMPITRARNLIVGVLAVAGMLVAASAAVAADPSGAVDLKVYTANVENLLHKTEHCKGDWDELVYYMAAQKSVPKAILLQQVNNQKQVNKFVRRLNRATRTKDFTGIVAPGNANGTKNCKGEKRRQLNAIAWNTVALTLQRGTVKTWESVRENSRGGGPRCVENDQSRTRNIKAVFSLGQGAPDVTLASVHWPTKASGGVKCADNNARALHRELSESPYSATVQIVGGDMNITDRVGGRHRKWYRQMIAMNFADAEAENPDWTHISGKGAGAKRRIDYLFARRGTSTPATFTNPATVSFKKAHAAEKRLNPSDKDRKGCDTYPKAPEKGCSYSEHRSVTARVN